jgi:hypothetical protein
MPGMGLGCVAQDVGLPAEVISHELERFGPEGRGEAVLAILEDTTPAPADMMQGMWSFARRCV